jgi:RNA methyltransferase, TrmH family
VKKYEYKKSSGHSFTIGVYPTIELLKAKPETVEEIILSSKGSRNKGIDKILDLCRKNKIKVVYNDALVNRISRTDNNYAAGVFRKYSPSIDRNADHLMLVNPSDMGNMGTTLRTALAFGFVNVAIIKPAIDIFSPKVVRSSMGAIFSIKFQYFDNLEEYLALTQGKRETYLFDLSGDKYPNDMTPSDKVTMIFGNEGEGLNKNYLSKGTVIKIPHTKNVDSLNLPVSVGIALSHYYNLKRNI